MLPDKFLENMKKQLFEENSYDKFIHSYKEESYSGLRVNTLKISVEEFIKIFPFNIEKIKGIDNGFYFNKEDKLSKHPYYHGGLFYIQEPSAMIPGNIIDIQNDDIVLDLCAAPGGKTTQVGSRLKNSGLLVSNDISTGRVKGLIKNIEMFGIKNAIVTNENHINILKKTYKFFDKILIDAPCSGEGMFRKSSNLTSQWSDDKVYMYRDIQEEILNTIKDSLKSGGQMVYSTCTFNKLENEDQLNLFVLNNKEFFIDEIEEGGEYKIKDKFLRVWPHLNKGEGHFACKLKKIDMGEETDKRKPKRTKIKSDKIPIEFIEFQNKFLRTKIEGKFKIIDNRLYLLPEVDIDTTGLRVARSGWLLGDIKNKKFIPSQAFAMGLKKEEFLNTIDLDIDSLEVKKYLKGETINLNGKDGYNLICVSGFPLGFGIMEKGRLKNKYPASWRLI